ncbi:hypothetical protein SCUCBS95973_008129 [Sporothrix curviconia]|uniref:Uncharacterized protein n=1 Tax=Sporothrix curviconia TaxID=1260050 RepID=A0ABP0CJ29_9PEZI
MHIANFDQVSSDIAGSTQGWTSSSSNRGTFDIIWSTLSQYLAAKNSVKKLKDSGYDGWTIRNGFYAAMGGFVLHSPDFVPFPLNVDQVHYLVSHGYIDYKDVLIEKEVIEDQNKFDTLTRILTTVQLLWFVVNAVARGSLRMAITTLEFSTIAFIFVTIFTCYFWRYKPQDIAAPIIIDLKVPLAIVLVEAGELARHPYSYSPLDFAESAPHWFQLIWRYCFNIARALFKVDFHSRKRPVDKIWDDQFSRMGIKHGLILAFVQLSFAAIHFTAWNFHFPSNVERILWRVSASYIICSMFCTWVVIYAGFEIFPSLAALAEKRLLPVSEKEPRAVSFLAQLYLLLRKPSFFH